MGFDAPHRNDQRRRTWAALLAFAICALLLQSCQPGSAIPWLAPPSSRILFIGNSLTFYNGGVDQQIKGLDGTLAVGNVVAPGFTLEQHWNGTAAKEAIHRDKWDFVVLQEQSLQPVLNQSSFIKYVSDFNNEIRSTGAQTVLFMTWERPDSVQTGVTTRNLANAYYLADSQLGAKIAPVGLAFSRSLQMKPSLTLNIEDGHPTLAGTYLAACVLYATMLEKSPVGLHYAPAGLTPEDRDFLQSIAAGIMGY